MVMVCPLLSLALMTPGVKTRLSVMVAVEPAAALNKVVRKERTAERSRTKSSGSVLSTRAGTRKGLALLTGWSMRQRVTVSFSPEVCTSGGARAPGGGFVEKC